MGKGMSSARRHLPGKARTAVVCGLILFVGGQLTLSLLMERPRAELRDLDFGTHHARLQKQLSDHPDQPLALFLGSSRTFLGFRPANLPEYRSEDGSTPLVFNFGVLAAGPL